MTIGEFFSITILSAIPLSIIVIVRVHIYFKALQDLLGEIHVENLKNLDEDVTYDSQSLKAFVADAVLLKVGFTFWKRPLSFVPKIDEFRLERK